MRSLLRNLLIVFVSCWPSLATAEVRNFVIEADGTTCTPGLIASNQDPTGLRLSVSDAANRLGAFAVQYVKTDGQATTVSLTGGTMSATVLIVNAERRPSSRVTLTGKVAGTDVTCLKDEEIPISGPNLTDIDDKAEIWLLSELGKKAVDRLRKQPGSPTVLLHLPSGRVASSNPPSIREDAPILVAAVIDTNFQKWVANLNVLACPDRDPNRVLGNFDSVTTQRAEPVFELMPAARPIECGAGVLQYAFVVSRNNVDGAEQRASWRVRPVYRFSATMTLGYDAGQDKSYGVKEGTIALTPNPTSVGFKSKIGFTWFPLGIDYENMRWYNYFVNPVALFDLDAPKKAFVIGNSITPGGGVSLTIGGSFRKVPVPKDGKVGDPTKETSVTTQEDWAPEGRSWYFGVSLDTKIFSTLKGIKPKAPAK